MPRLNEIETWDARTFRLYDVVRNRQRVGPPLKPEERKRGKVVGLISSGLVLVLWDGDQTVDQRAEFTDDLVNLGSPDA